MNVQEIIVKYWLEFAMALIAGVLMRKLHKIDRYVKEVDYAKSGVQALLRDRIVAQYNTYMKQGAVPIYARENIEKMYKEYKHLGGNGAIDHLVEKLHDLPTDKKGV